MDGLNKAYKGIWYGAKEKPMTVKELLNKVIENNGRSFWLQKTYDVTGNRLLDVKEVAVLRDENDMEHGTGSYDYAEAVEMAKDRGCEYIGSFTSDDYCIEVTKID